MVHQARNRSHRLRKTLTKNLRDFFEPRLSRFTHWNSSVVLLVDVSQPTQSFLGAMADWELWHSQKSMEIRQEIS